MCWDDNDLIDGCPTGAVRVSLGYSSTTRDVAAVLHFVQTYFVDGAESNGAASAARVDERRSSHEGASCAPQVSWFEDEAHAINAELGNHLLIAHAQKIVQCLCRGQLSLI